jgi:hypothetical protein
MGSIKGKYVKVETICPHYHRTIKDAIRCAQRNIGRKMLKPFVGMKLNRLANFRKVIGFQTEDRKARFRLDFDEGGLHVNEEDKRKRRYVRHNIDIEPKLGQHLMLLKWQKWKSWMVHLIYSHSQR